MAQAKNKERAEWADLEVRELIDYLHQNRSESVGGNFSGDIYDAAADHIAKYLSQGPKKTGSMCKTKWASIKHLHAAIENYRNQSGFHWDDDHGAGIEGKEAEAVWMTYTKQKANMVLRPYRNCGWEHFKKVEEIVPSALARGSNAFRPSLAMIPPVLDDDEDDSVATGKRSKSDGGSAGAGAVASDANIVVHPPNPRSHSTTSSGKRKFSAMDETSSFTSRSKMSSSAVTSLSARQSKASSPNEGIVMTGMQGSINRLTDVIEKTFVPPPPPPPLPPLLSFPPPPPPPPPMAPPPPPPEDWAAQLSEAVMNVQKVDYGLSAKEKVQVIKNFSRDTVSALTYNLLDGYDVRREWILDSLGAG